MDHVAIRGPRAGRLRALVGVVTAVLGVTTAGVGARQDARDLSVAVVAREVQPGEVIRLDVTCRCGDAIPRVVVLDADIPLLRVASEGEMAVWQGLVGLDVDTPAGVYPLTLYEPGLAVADRAHELRVLPKQFATRRLQVAPAFVDPPADEVQRILKEAAALDALFMTMTPRLWNGPFVAPVAARATGNFGSRSVFNGQPRNPHGGVDFRSPTGTPIVAPGAGRIVLAEDLFFTGTTVVIDHGFGLFSVLAHLSTTAVAQGDIVERGTLVGRVGATGRVTGPHLHWGIRLNGARVDPLSLLFATHEEPRAPGAARPTR